MNESRQSPPNPGRLLRLPQVLEIIPVAPSTWWAGVKSGRYPAAIKLSERITCWRESEIQALVTNDASFKTDICPQG